MAFFPDPSIWLEHLQWETKFSPHIIHSASQSQLFSNFASYQDNNNYNIDDFDHNSFINAISSQLSNDVIQNIMKVVYTDSIYHSLQLNQNCPMHVEKQKSNLRRTKSFNFEQKDSIFDEHDEFIDFDQLDCCNFDDSCEYHNEKHQSFNTLS
ncbi:hypothetical protein M9Y10_012433 [Tritrichomonas musculus]|uniref:Uncharacterized protein n=1 Tax=Tritrichomonas musculus TaxID=1915356 RepID=A0ABR2IDB9_9EUKA